MSGSPKNDLIWERGRYQSELRRNGRLSVGLKSEKEAENPLMPVNHLGKGYFFLYTTLPGCGRDMVRVKGSHH